LAGREPTLTDACGWNVAADSGAVHTEVEMWPGVAGVLQSSLVLGAGLLLWLSRAPQYSVYGF